MKFNIFIVDDEQDFIDSTKVWNFDNCDIHVFLDPFKAVPELIKIKPDIIITDVKMPIYNGFQFAYIAQNIIQHKNIIVISANEKEEVEKLTDGEDLTNFFRKPLGEEFFEFVSQMVKDLDKQEKPDFEKAERRIKQLEILQNEYNQHQDNVEKFLLDFINNKKDINDWPSSKSIEMAVKMLDFSFEELPTLVEKLNKNVIPWEKRIKRKIDLENEALSGSNFTVDNENLKLGLPKKDIGSVKIIKSMDEMYLLEVNDKPLDCAELDYHKYEFFDCKSKREAISYVYCKKYFNIYNQALNLSNI